MGDMASVFRFKVTGASISVGNRAVIEEVPVAIIHDAVTYAVMMATPLDLEDFAIGFSLTEGCISAVSEVRAVEICETEFGIEARLWLVPGRSIELAERRRRLAGPTGCGLCGVESLQEAVRPPRTVEEQGLRLSFNDIHEAVAAMPAAQRLGAATKACHAAGYWRKGEGLVQLREDVGRHNALDKLAGVLAKDGVPMDGIIVLTSRVSVEMVQKTAAMGISVLVAVSAPTALAVRVAESAGITLIAIARVDGFEIFTHAHRVMDIPDDEGAEFGPARMPDHS